MTSLDKRKLEQLRREALDELRPIIPRLESAVLALKLVTMDLMEEYEDG